MQAFFGAIALVSFITGIVLLILGKIKKKKYYGGWITIISFIVFIIAVVTTPTENNRDETDTYKVSSGEITNKKLLIDLAVRAETIIEKYDKIDNVKVDQHDIKAKKMSDMKDDATGEVYKNVYYIDGMYSWQDKKYDFEWCVSFDENNTDSAGKVLQYTSDMLGGKKINVRRSTVERLLKQSFFMQKFQININKSIE